MKFIRRVNIASGSKCWHGLKMSSTSWSTSIDLSSYGDRLENGFDNWSSSWFEEYYTSKCWSGKFSRCWS